MKNVKKKRGRPKKVKSIPTRFYDLIKRGASVRLACQATGLPRRTLYDWILEAQRGTDDSRVNTFYKKYIKAMDAAIGSLYDDLEAEQTEERTKTKDGEGNEEVEIIKTNPPALAKWKLARRYPLDFSIPHLEPEMIEELEDEDEDVGVIDWRNPDLHAFRSGNCKAIVDYPGTHLLVVGPTRSGKTLRILEFLFGLVFANAGMRICICRAKEVDLRDTIKVDLKDTLFKYDLSDPLSPIQAVGGDNFFRLTIKHNKSRIDFVGMDRPGKILGTKYDIVYYSQMEQSTPEEYQKLTTRVSGDSKNWRDPETGAVRNLLIGDANPAQDSHYLLEYEKDRLIDFINFGFHDNPLLFRNGKQTPDGDRVIGNLDKSLIGLWHDRLFKSLWVSAEGVVFSEFSKKRHVRAIEKPTGGTWVMAVDFGFTDPCSALLINDKDGLLTVWRELYKVGLTLDDFIAEAWTILAGEDIEIEAMVCDHNSEHIERLTREGFPAVHAEKPMIVTGLELIRSRLVNDRLVISDRVNRSPDPNIDKGPKGLIDEFGAYVYKPPEKRLGNRRDDIPIDANNHSIDPLRYACHYFDRGNDVPEIGAIWNNYG